MNDKYLTTSGRERRTAILQLAIREAKRRKRRRIVIFPGVVATLLAVAVGIPVAVHALRLPRQSRLTSLAQDERPVASHPVIAIVDVPASQPAGAVEYVATDPTITARLSIKPEVPRWMTIDDNQLQQALADAGHPADVVYIDGKAKLVRR